MMNEKKLTKQELEDRVLSGLQIDSFYLRSPEEFFEIFDPIDHGVIFSQQACVAWLRLQYPALAQLLIHVPNGGQRGNNQAPLYSYVAACYSSNFSGFNLDIENGKATADIVRRYFTSDLIKYIEEQKFNNSVIKIAIEEFSPCREGLEFYSKFNTTWEAWEACDNPHWLIFLAEALEIDQRKLVGCAGECAATVKHLMKDKLSLYAVEACAEFAAGEIGAKELERARKAALMALSDIEVTTSAGYSAAHAAHAATTYSAERTLVHAIRAAIRADPRAVGMPNAPALVKIIHKWLDREMKIEIEKRKGVSDLLLLVPNGTVGCLCIELKTSTGRQSDAQKVWQGVSGKHNKYIVVRNLEQFINEINNYLK